MSKINSSGKAMMLVDTVAHTTDANLYGSQMPHFQGACQSRWETRIHLIHNGRANTVFFDGHAKGMDPYQMNNDTDTMPRYFYTENISDLVLP